MVAKTYQTWFNKPLNKLTTWNYWKNDVIAFRHSVALKKSIPLGKLKYNQPPWNYDGRFIYRIIYGKRKNYYLVDEKGDLMNV